MKVVFISTGISKNEDYIGGNIGGIEKQIYGIANEFSKLGHTVFIIRKWNKSYKKDIFEKINFINIKGWFNDDNDIRFSPIGAILSRLIFSKIASNKVKEIKPDVVFVNEKLSSFFISYLNIRKIFIVHIPPYELIKENFPNNTVYKIIFFFLEKFEKKILKRYQKIVSLNSSINQYFQLKGYNSIYIPNGINYAEYNLKNDKNYILYGGRLIPEKGLIYLFKAYSELKKIHQVNIKLLVIGSGICENSLKRYVKLHALTDYVEFIPWLNSNDFKRKIEECTIFVLPSLFECMPVSLLEAMACGKSVIASNIPGPQDIIIHGYNGFLFEKGNVQKLKECLIILLEDDEIRNMLGINARLTIEKEYSFEKIAKSYINILN